VSGLPFTKGTETLIASQIGRRIKFLTPPKNGGFGPGSKEGLPPGAKEVVGFE